MSLLAEQPETWFLNHARFRRVAASHVLLTLALLAALPLMAWLGRRSFDEAGVRPAVVSVVLMWSCATFSLWILAFSWADRQRLAATLIGVGMRTVAPLLVGGYLLRTRPELAAAGLVSQLTGAYLLTLTLETVLTVWVLDPTFSSFKNKRD